MRPHSMAKLVFYCEKRFSFKKMESQIILLFFLKEKKEIKPLCDFLFKKDMSAKN